MQREGLPWADATARLLLAGLAAARGDRTDAAPLWEEAAGRLEAVDMALYAWAARRRLGELQGADGAALIAQADAWMAGQGIRNPARMAAMIAPGPPG
jgi:hypothetical protein